MSQLQQLAKKYTMIDTFQSWKIVLTTGVALVSSLLLAHYFYSIHFLLSIPFSLLAAGFMVKSFIIMHDCGHGTMFSDRKTRDRVGIFFSLFTFTPYYQWRNDHASHHQTSGNLDKRGVGDIWTMTVREYEESSRFEKLQYLLYRHPFVTFVIGPFFLFFIRFRFPHIRDDRQSKINIHLTSLFMFTYFAASVFIFGLTQTLVINALVYGVATFSGTFLFYMQHQYEDCYWRNEKEWDYTTAAMAGSSYFKLPRLLQWFSGNIGFHHIHHLNHRIPFYNLEKCYLENPEFQCASTLNLRQAFQTIFIKFYDEDQQRMVTMSQYKRNLDLTERFLETA